MKLPPMNALRAFEAVSRQGSVSKAAEELCVSQGAVSQQLRNLEDYLGRELFHRSANSFTLTEDAEVFAAVLQESVQQISAAASTFMRVRSQHLLRISAPASLIRKWVMPKLDDFYARHPGVVVVFDESLDLVTFKNDGFDAALRYADGHFDNLHSHLLIELKIYAVASPDYLARVGRPEAIEHPRGHHLIDHYYDAKSVNSQHLHWRDIVDGDLDAMNIEHLVYPDGLQSLTAAVHGQGIALVPMYLCEEEVATGKLALLSDAIHQDHFSYYFVAPADARANPAIDHFRDWLLEKSRDYRDPQ